MVPSRKASFCLRAIFFVILFGLSLTALPQTASAYPVLHSELHGWSWYQSTVLSGFTKPSTSNFVRIDLAAPSGGTLRTHLWKAKGVSRGLYIVLPGTGADATSSNSNVLAETIARQGFDAFILTDPFSADFQKTFSADGLVGFPQKDYADTDKMIRAGLRAYTVRYGSPRTLGLVGYSLGGLYALMAAQDGPFLHFDKYIALNPPINFKYAMDQLDVLMRLNQSRPFSVRHIVSDLLHALRITSRGFTTDDLAKIKKVVPANKVEDEQIIGTSFHLSLYDITERLARTSSFSSAAKKKEIVNALPTIGFTRYMEIVGAELKQKGYFPGTSFSQLLIQADLRRVLSGLPRNANIFIIDNQDDLLATDQSLQDVSNLIGSRLTVFESGGHCGNYWTDSFKHQLADILAK